MDSHTHGFLLSAPSLHPVYYQSSEDDGIIDLGLSLRALQPQVYHQTGHRSLEGYGGYDEMLEWPQLKEQSNQGCGNVIREECEEETEGVQSKARCAYVKVNMDGVVIGRKICVLDLAGYSSLALQLEDMFGRHSLSGLRLFQKESEFALLYKDRDENWRTVCDVSWKEFVDTVKRLRIVGKNEAHFPSSLECT